MYFRQLRLPDMGCASYIIGDDGACIVVDPRWDAVRHYIGLARQQSLQITHIIETHTHADHVSGATRLAARTGATILIHRNARVTYPHQDVDDGDEIAIGSVHIKVLYTPGHSFDSISLLVHDTSRTEPGRLLSGDTLFVGEVGRPDLHDDTAVVLAGALYSSLHDRLLQLDEQVEVYPAHLAGSLCGKRIAPEPSTTIDRERQTNPTLSIARGAFVQAIITNLPPRPPNVERILHLNRSGAPLKRPEVTHVTPAEAATLLSQGTAVVDGRDVPTFAQSHIKGAINVPIGYGQFGVMVAWLLPPETPLLLIAADEEDLNDAVDSLMAVGMTNRLAALQGTPQEWSAAGLETVPASRINVEALERLLARKEAGTVIDVREAVEVGKGTLARAINLPYRQIKTREELPPLTEPVVVICNSGNRSSVAASLLERLGIHAIDVAGGTTAWSEAGYPLVYSETAFVP